MDIRIEYCVQWNYEPRALSLRDDLNEEFGIWAKLVTGERGAFEVFINETVIFSKLHLDRFPKEREVIRLIREKEEN